MPSKLNVGSRLISLVILMTIFMVAIGIIGLRATSTAVSSLETVYTDRTVPLARSAPRSAHCSMPTSSKSCALYSTIPATRSPNCMTTRFPSTSTASRPAGPNLTKPGHEYIATYLTPEEKHWPKTSCKNARCSRVKPCCQQCSALKTTISPSTPPAVS